MSVEQGGPEIQSRIPEHQPIVDGPSFSIDFVAPTTDGFTLRTRQVNTRSAAIQQIATEQVAQGAQELTPPEQQGMATRWMRNLRRGINPGNKGEVAFQARRNPDAKPLTAPDFEFKANLNGFVQDGNELSFDLQPTTFVMYNDRDLGLSKPENRDMGERLANPLGVAAVLFTTEADGSRKMIIQHRGDNASYKDQPGASIAGITKHEMHPLDEHNPAKRGKMKDFTNEDVERNLKAEAEEELGLDPDTLTKIAVMGVATDKIKIHKELLCVAITSLTAEQVAEMAQRNLSVKRGAFDFAEKMFVLPATVDAIETLTSEVECPLPPTHDADFLTAGGYYLKLEQEGQEAASEWLKRVGQQSLDNYDRINERVKEATNGAEKGYNPGKRPSEQGLPGATEALTAKGLITA